jgi:putative DNA primase/helicase
MCTGTPYDPDATCPRWDRFLCEVFGADDALVGFVQRAVGYSLTGDTSEQCLFLCYGTGANGKGTLTHALHHVLGDYAYAMPFSTVELQQRSAIPNDLAALLNRRFVSASETNDGTRLNESRIKALTGGDPLTARFLHAEFFTFDPVGKYWLAVNHKPVVRDDSYAFWRRLRLIPFTETFRVNKALGRTLRDAAPGILAWAVRGCLAWQEHGLDPPATVTRATADYAAESDVLRAFLDEATEPAPEEEVQASALFTHYRRWADRHGLSDRERLSATAFGRKARERFPARTVNGRRFYQDLRLLKLAADPELEGM